MPVPSTPTARPARGDSTPTGTRTRARTAPSNEDVARTAVSVFGDTTVLHHDSTAGPDAAPLWDIDVRSFETHERVAHYVQLFTTNARGHFVERLSRGTRYEPMIRAKLRASGMPEDLTYLALIESGYDPHAYSRAAAVGMWQFMSSTARDVGLRVDWWMDERRDPVRSTEGAIRFLGGLRKQFGGSLYLAAAAYNGGPGRIARGLTRIADELEGAGGDAQFFKLADHDYLRTETKNYVPQLIAAALVAKMPSRYGLAVDSTSPLTYDSVLVSAGTSMAVVATASSSSPAVLKDLNPSILRGVTPPDTSVWVHVPTGQGARTFTSLDRLGDADRMGFSTLRVAGATVTLASVAHKAGITLKQLAWFNPALKTTKRGRLIAGQSLRVPHRDVFAFARDLPDPSIERYGTSDLARGGFHVVRRGESIASIASRYKVSVTRLKSMNGIRGNRVVPGQTLRVSAVKASKAPKASAGKKSASKKGAAKKAGAKKKAAAKH